MYELESNNAAFLKPKIAFAENCFHKKASTIALHFWQVFSGNIFIRVQCFRKLHGIYMLGVHLKVSILMNE